MCELTQFVVSLSTNSIDASTLAQLFMYEVVQTFGMCSVMVIDDGSTFESVFISMCVVLSIQY